MHAALIVVFAVTALAPGSQIGANSVPPKDGTCPVSHPIKAVVTPRTKECVYQRPDDLHYRSMRPDLCFRSEDESRQEDCWQAKEVL